MYRSTLLCLGLVSGLLALPTGAKEASAPPANPKATSLSLTKLSDDSALLSGRFPQFEAGSRFAFSLGKEEVEFSDTGENGDLKAKDGLFTAKVPFDFEAFTKANQILAEGKERELALFAPADRQQLGSQKWIPEGDQLLVLETLAGKERRFALPLDPRLVPIGEPLPLPPLGPPVGLPPDNPVLGPTSIPDSLMITKLSTVNDPSRTWACQAAGSAPSGNPQGDWTFWQLMENMANGTASTSDFIKELFGNWQNNQLINGHNVAARPGVYQQVITAWENRSGGPGADLLPQQSPFRLLGIVLRADLRGGGSFYGGGDAGEGRFVFALHDGNCNPMAKTLILEYKVPIRGCTAIRDWARDWKALSSSANYNDDLQQLTDVFTQAGAAPLEPNASAISQVRSNELLPQSPGWELREFVLPQGGGFLTQTSVKQEPQLVHNNSALLASFINSSWNQLVGPPSGNHEVTLAHNSQPFLAGAAPSPVLWNVQASQLTAVPTTASPVSPFPATVQDDAVFELAVNTCSGCHTLETGTSFAHLHYNTMPGQPALLSGFLTGISLPDTRKPAISRHFNDLARRAQDLDNAANLSCRLIGEVPFGNLVLRELTAAPPLRAVH
ncbi:hypothetical protein [Gallaecimonas xiamenensis]|uniref:hypothetical protein n=1 Tax=Gallaecimonas xiamenensis TaxID=1207039 RepID=UPI0004BA410D|nr:hypothetical protein [Gallaecimonas xiamenensis]